MRIGNPSLTATKTMTGIINRKTIGDFLNRGKDYAEASQYRGNFRNNIQKPQFPKPGLEEVNKEVKNQDTQKANLPKINNEFQSAKISNRNNLGFFSKVVNYIKKEAKKVIVGASCAGAGAAIGTAICPGVGTAAGVVVGGIVSVFVS
ncbi:MAG: hypothetical protein AB1633_07365 [Elusimicrobiota bacterium]